MAWNTRRWVKVSVYEKPEFLMLPWQTRGLYRLITPHLGPTGRLYVGKDMAAGLAVVLHCKKEEIESHLEILTTNGFVVAENSDTIFDPLFLQSSQTDKPSNDKPASLDIDVEVEVDKKKKKPGRPPADPRHNAVIDLFHDLWAELRGGKYVVQGRDTRSVADLLRKIPGIELSEFENRIRAALSDGWFRDNGSLQMFCLQWSKWERVTPIRRSARAIVSMDYESGTVTYSDGTTGPMQSGGSR